MEEFEFLQGENLCERARGLWSGNFLPFKKWEMKILVEHLAAHCTLNYCMEKLELYFIGSYLASLDLSWRYSRAVFLNEKETQWCIYLPLEVVFKFSKTCEHW